MLFLSEFIFDIKVDLPGCKKRSRSCKWQPPQLKIKKKGGVKKKKKGEWGGGGRGLVFGRDT